MTGPPIGLVDLLRLVGTPRDRTATRQPELVSRNPDRPLFYGRRPNTIGERGLRQSEPLPSAPAYYGGRALDASMQALSTDPRYLTESSPAYVAGETAVRSINPIADALAGLRDALRGVRAGDPATVGLSALAALPFFAYHGSPYRFDKFDAAKIGTGEGGAAFGHGLYFAENPSVADFYATQRRGGRTYRVRINADSERDFLDLDAPIGRQPEAVRAFADEVGPFQVRDGMPIGNGMTLGIEENALGDPVYFMVGRGGRSRLSESDVRNLVGDGTTGKSLYAQLLTRYGTDAEVSRVLHERGIQGIRYFDQGSRSASAARWLLTSPEGMVRDYATRAEAEAAMARIGGSLTEPSATRNYVLFDPERVSIQGTARPRRTRRR